jgi:exosortase
MKVLARILFVALILLPFFGSLAELAHLAIGDDRYTYTLLAPFAAGALGWFHFRRAVPVLQPRLGLAAGLVAVAAVLGIAGVLGAGADLSLRILLLVFLMWGTVFALFGGPVCRQVLFPLAVLTLFIPLPLPWMERIVGVLQIGSADTAFGLFKLVGVPVHRISPFLFSLPGLEMEVAEECSGIRSTTSLFVSSIVTVYLTLDSGWQRFLVVLLVIPVSIAKNALRIVTLSYLGIYVDRGFFYGELHRQGGIPFSILAVFLLGGVILFLRRWAGSTPVAQQVMSSGTGESREGVDQ